MPSKDQDVMTTHFMKPGEALTVPAKSRIYVEKIEVGRVIVRVRRVPARRNLLDMLRGKR